MSRSLILVTLLAFCCSAFAQEKAAPKPQIPLPDPKAAEVPEGYSVTVAFQELMYPSSIEFDNLGAIYIAECGFMPGDETQPARILKYTSVGQAGLKTQKREVVADDLSGPVTDLLWHESRLFISHKGKISVLEDGKVRDIVTDLPSLGDHSNGQMTLGLDNKIYFGLGSATNAGVVGEDNFANGWAKKHPEVCETTAKDIVITGQTFETADPRSKDKATKVKTSAYQPFGKTVPDGTVIKGRTKANCTVLRVNTDGSDLEVFAWGFRNPYGVAWGPDKQLYVGDSGSDERGSRHIANAPEKLFAIKQGAWYGWPDFISGIPVTDPRYKPSKSQPPKFLLKEHAPAEKPLLTFEPHASLTQIDFSKSPRFGFEGQLFLGASGDQSPNTAAQEVRAGYWIKRVDLQSGQAEMFFRTRPDALGPKGLEYVTTAGPKRIVDVRFSPDGDALYAVDIGPIHYVPGKEGPQPMAFPNTGVVWRIARSR
jgi:glucose/arabinose dehydrogenase